MKFKLGVLVNPFAGIGGSVALKGSDGDDTRIEALARGAELRAQQRMVRALEKLQVFATQLSIYCFAGDMGEIAVMSAGFSPQVVGAAVHQPSTEEDTRAAVNALLEQGVDIILFAGGDGTARNVADALEAAQAAHQVVLGVPSGVKMHSGVYAITPEAAGEILHRLLCHRMVHIQLCEVRDIDEGAFREGKVKTRLYSHMQVPVVPELLQQVKNSGAEQDELVKVDIAHYLIDHYEEDALYIVGPGSTTKVFLDALGVSGTLLGVDVVCGRELIVADVTAMQLRNLIANHPGTVKLVLTAIGAQGHIIGRGNQQVAADILQAIPRQQIQVIATKEKIHSLDGRPLLVDSNDPLVDKSFSGFQSILVGYDEFILYPIGLSEDVS